MRRNFFVDPCITELFCFLTINFKISTSIAVKYKHVRSFYLSPLQTTAMKRTAKMIESAEVIFLCSKEASYITGVVLPEDGGATA